MYRQVAITENPLAFDAPAKGMVRGIPPQRARRLRISWFILGTLFGMLCMSFFHWLMTADNEVAFPPGQEPATHASPSPGSSSRKTSSLPPETRFVMTVSKGDTLMDMLTSKGVDYQEAHLLIQALRKEYNPRRLIVGQEVELQLNPDYIKGMADFAVLSLGIRLSPLAMVELTQAGKGLFDIATHEKELTTELASGGGIISSSLYQTGIDSGVPPAILSALINAYSYDVDFQREIKPGDQFNVVFEQLKTDDDVTAGHGKLLYATLTLGGQEKKIYHFARENGEEGYYDANGQSVRKALLRTPINGARLSSGFGMRRHPVLGYGKMHKGVDFAAPPGTPIYAAGDGIVEYASRYGSFGNYVRISHNTKYKTAYAHMQRIATRKGAHVKQGDIIGYVGTTGRSTGPHLHYEVLANGAQVNPKNVKFPTGHTLQGSELAAFRANTKQMDLIAYRLIQGEAQLARAE